MRRAGVPAVASAKSAWTAAVLGGRGQPRARAPPLVARPFYPKPKKHQVPSRSRFAARSVKGWDGGIDHVSTLEPFQEPSP
jgi:hypothetical protein